MRSDGRLLLLKEEHYSVTSMTLTCISTQRIVINKAINIPVSYQQKLVVLGFLGLVAPINKQVITWRENERHYVRNKIIFLMINTKNEVSDKSEMKYNRDDDNLFIIDHSL